MNIRDFQKEVHRRNREKGFYDYENDLAVVEDARNRIYRSEVFPGLGGDPFQVEMSPTEYFALSRILADYRKLQLERKLLLAIGELVEAHGELRAGHSPSEIYYSPSNPAKPEGFGIEVADAHIRLLDLEEAQGIDAEGNMVLKHSYNGTRAYKHGKQF